MDPASLYGVTREEANWRRNGGWAVALRRQGRSIRRLFKDSLYGSSEAALAEAKAYRDAAVDALPPCTNRQKAVRLRKTNKSGIVGVRRIDDRSGVCWQATLLTRAGQKSRRFSVKLYGEDEAKAMAITQRQEWFAALQPSFLIFNAEAEAVITDRFSDHLAHSPETLSEGAMPPAEIDAALRRINASFDARQPRKLRGRAVSKVFVAASSAD